ncbi:septum formation family protein [Nocardioides sp. zg-536]|uniref:Septum formation family protein n=2 Tax=Nocardioides faecalis TaxID=2803858 RepID=A0A938Y184_9ACTN|nr:septum formation family protein [Nocardioides faecalis]MBS4751217.1 septum formation family protein [Nocardioides faecalis]QVI60506.1 septum formation family protein [Nocardioides faecalis]
MSYRRGLAPALLALLLLAVGSACGAEDQGQNSDPDLVDAVEVPTTGLCRVLTPDDVRLPANATKPVPCTQEHTAETFAAGELPPDLSDLDYDDPALGAFAYKTCSAAFADFVGADESLVLRTTISWAWFRPSEKAWNKGARWYRCDVIGGNAASASYRPLPQTAKGMLAGRPKDTWLSCARGPSVAQGEKVPCSEKHDWRAVTTVKIGDPDDKYPGDRVMESRTRSFCSQSVKAWLNYPTEYEFGFTFFHAAEWKAGVRRSVCWARTSE